LLRFVPELPEGRIVITAAAYGEIAFGSSDEQLLSFVYGLAFGETQVHGGLAVTEPTDGFYLLQGVRVKQQMFRPFEESVLKIVFEAEAYHGHSQAIRHGAELPHLSRREKVSLIHKNAMDIFGHGAEDLCVKIRVLVEAQARSFKTVSGSHGVLPAPGIQGGGKDKHPFSLDFIVCSHPDKLSGFAGTHGSVTKVELSQNASSPFSFT
jgi:hypothetical protein